MGRGLRPFCVPVSNALLAHAICVRTRQRVPDFRGHGVPLRRDDGENLEFADRNRSKRAEVDSQVAKKTVSARECVVISRVAEAAPPQLNASSGAHLLFDKTARSATPKRII